MVVVLGGKFSGELKMVTENGKVTCVPPEGTKVLEDGNKSKHLHLGEDLTLSTLATTNGNIRVEWKDV